MPINRIVTNRFYLQVAMNDELAVQVGQPFQQLHHDTFDLRLSEGHLHVVYEASQVLLAVTHDQEHVLQVFPNHYLRNQPTR